MSTITYTSRLGMRLLGLETGAWMDTTDATTDLTGNSKTLTENGTLTQSAVSTGGPVMQYTGFSTLNYLSRAYDADLEYLASGTDGMTVMAWVNIGTVSDVETIFDRAETGGTGTRWNLRIHSDGKLKAVISDGTDTHTADGVLDLNNYGWTHIAATWNGIDTITLFVNGQADAIDTTGLTVSASDGGTEVFRIGLSATGTDPCAQGLSLCKIQGSYVSAGNIRYVYDSEKSIFEDNGSYLVYGDSTSVTFPAMVLNRTVQAIRTVSSSISGVRQTLHDRQDIVWDITTSELTGTEVTDVRNMLSSVFYGESFTFDAYDNDNTISCTIATNTFTEERVESSDYMIVAFQVVAS